MKHRLYSLGVAACLSLMSGVWLSYVSGSAWADPDRGAAPTAKYTWKNVAIVGGGFVSGIITHPKEKGLMYARTDVGGAYRWDDKAKRWVSLTDEFGLGDWNFTGIESIAVDPTDPNKVYMAVGTYTNDWAGTGAILRSVDKGNTWKRTDLTFKNGGNEDGRSAGERLAVDPNLPTKLFFGTRNEGLWQSNDSGATWTKSASFPVQSRTNGIGTVFVLFDKATGSSTKGSKTIYAGVSDKTTSLYRSDDYGVSWKPVSGQPVGLLPHHGVLTTDGFLYLTYANAPGPNGMGDGAVWKLEIKTGIWTNITPEKPGEGNGFGYAGVSVDAKSPQTLVVSTMDRWARHDTIFRSVDGGKNWTDLGPKSERDSSLSPYLNWGRPKADLGHWIGDIEIDPFNSDRVLYVTGATIWTSLDATAADKGQPTHWVVGANGLEETVVNDVVSPASGAQLFSVVWDIDGFRHENLDVSPSSGFLKPAHGRNTAIDFAQANPNVLARVFGGGTGGAYSTDNGVTWTDFAKSPVEKAADGVVAVSAQGTTIVWTPERQNPFVTHDKGATWTAAKGLPEGCRVVSDRVTDSTFYAFDSKSGTVYVSKDSGATFTARATNLPKGDGFLRGSFGQAGDLWLASGGNGLYHSKDGGTTFAKIEAISEAQRIGFGKAASATNTPAVYLTGKLDNVNGFFRSDDGGTTWTRINDDKHDFHYISAITGDPRVYGRVYLATGGRGVIVGDLKSPQ